eukprot:4611514-Karenia_brevis.AAC.1
MPDTARSSANVTPMDDEPSPGVERSKAIIRPSKSSSRAPSKQSSGSRAPLLDHLKQTGESPA